MNDAKNWVGPFCNKSVPITLNTVILGFISVLILMGGVCILGIYTSEDNLVARTFFHLASCLGSNGEVAFGAIYSILPGNHSAIESLKNAPSLEAMFALLLWITFIWSFFGGAINRIVAHYIAKQSVISISSALKFSWRYKFSLFLSPFLLVLAIAFLLGCNWLAGYLAQTLGLFGMIVFIPVFFLIFLSTCLILFFGIGLLFGFNLIFSTISTEGCQGVEGVITTLQYLYTRPWSFITYQGLTVVLVLLMVFFGGIFLDVAFKSSLVSADASITGYYFDQEWTVVKITQKQEDKEIVKTFFIDAKKYQQEQQRYKKDFENASEAEKKALKGGEPVLYQTGMKDVWAYISGIKTVSWLKDENKNEIISNERPMVHENLWRLDKYWGTFGVILMIFYFAIQYLIYGYIFAYIFSATTTMYFLLRKEIDGADWNEIWEDDIKESSLIAELEAPPFSEPPVEEPNTSEKEEAERKQKGEEAEKAVQEAAAKEAQRKKKEEEAKKTAEEKKKQEEAASAKEAERKKEEEEAKKTAEEKKKQEEAEAAAAKEKEEAEKKKKEAEKNKIKEPTSAEAKSGKDEAASKAKKLAPKQKTKAGEESKATKDSKESSKEEKAENGDKQKELDTGTMAIPLIKRKSVEKNKQKKTEEFMD